MSQTEPALVISTQCRGCRTNFQVKDGKGVTRSQSVARLAKPRRDGDYEPPPAPPPPKAPPRYGPARPGAALMVHARPASRQTTARSDLLRLRP